MHTITIYPLGNADTSFIELSSGKLVLIDFADMRDPNDKKDKRADLPDLLRKKLKGHNRDEIDVVAFTHLDRDHYCGASEFFHLEWAAKYQGEGRIKIKEMWVPAEVILEEGLNDEGRIIRQEARHRLKQGKGIRVFSRPQLLKDWLKDNDLKLSDREHLITDAGNLVPGLNLETHGAEFFVHSPFAKRKDENEVVDRNNNALVLQVTFLEGGAKTRAFFCSDIDYDVLADIVEVTEKKKRTERLQNHIVKLSHHCSYNALALDKGATKTVPDPAVKRFFETYGQQGIILVSTSWPIPTDDSDAQPPHRQAAAYYRDVADDLGGSFKVTMDHPMKALPGPMEIQITGSKPSLLLPAIGGIGGGAGAGGGAAGSQPPRAG